MHNNTLCSFKGGFAFLTCMLLLTGGCDRDEAASEVTSIHLPSLQQTDYGAYARSRLSRLPLSASALVDSTRTFIKHPGMDTLTNARVHWLELHELLTSLEVYFLPLWKDSEVLPIIFRIEAWPLEPGFIDSLPDYPQSGIVNDVTLSLTETSLRTQHGATSDSELSTGMHTLEYFLWARPVADFRPQVQAEGVKPSTDISTEQLSNNRRRLMLLLMVDLLEKDLLHLQSQLSNALEVNPAASISRPLDAIQYCVYLIRRSVQQMEVEESGLHFAFSKADKAYLGGLLNQVSAIFNQQTNIHQLFSLLSHTSGNSVNEELATLTEMLVDAGVPNETEEILLLVSLLEQQLTEFAGQAIQ
jgi:hypothetical protein